MLVLASRSPRRAELLTAAGIEFTVRSADIDESVLPGEQPHDYVLRLAREKAAAIIASPGETVLAADTTVVLGSEIMGKPVDATDAMRMLRALAGRRHEVTTGFCVRNEDRILTDFSSTAVWFTSLTEEEIAWYVASGEPMDKAGAYAIQGLAARFIDHLEGSYSNVVGLPVAQVWQLLKVLEHGG